MSWADKQLKKHKLRKQIKEIMDSPEFQKERQKELDKHTAEAMNCFLLISVDYLYRNYHCKRKGVLKYLEFVLHQMHFAQKDEEYFQLMNEELESRHDAKALERFKRPAYQSVSVAEYLAKKYDITAEVDTIAERKLKE